MIGCLGKPGLYPAFFIPSFSKESFFSQRKFYMKSFFISSRIVYIYFIQKTNNYEQDYQTKRKTKTILL